MEERGKDNRQEEWRQDGRSKKKIWRSGNKEELNREEGKRRT